MSAPPVSHGRGGQGNVYPDDTKYTDGEVVREGEAGTGVSTGRGGAANITDSNAAVPRTDKEVVPEAAIRPSTEDTDHHTGRGGEGNVHHAHKEGGEDGTHKGLADKLKAKVLGVFKK
ncbi:hypothetical protein N8I77_004367 [Diaporthe amygdali]|uniref:Uncharacterized protein n=1 Tax=Phomopsis amygdali TaxID=1214568 RepID=A0AAD9SL57_PHOAM|nr:uncharacterized protein J7T55_008584 [Diaporthe amygdali]KAJ0121420.1 hypothetical protein J7T55_008584 [Diaporthe amygdali]KAK2610983.1 hypothetical protein N8I77_004367 [Diaporthe amygdali]